MKPGVAVFVLSGVLLCMLGVGLSQTTDRTGNSNTAANCTEADRRPRRLANGGYWNSEIEREKNIDANTGKTITNGSWNAACARWDYEPDRKHRCQYCYELRQQTQPEFDCQSQQT